MPGRQIDYFAMFNACQRDRSKFLKASLELSVDEQEWAAYGVQLASY